MSYDELVNVLRTSIQLTLLLILYRDELKMYRCKSVCSI